jgi:hypothetical protein
MLAGEEGLEPPYPVLETGVLAVGRLPFTLSPAVGEGLTRPLLPVASPNFLARLQPLIFFSSRRAASLAPQHSLQIKQTGLRFAVYSGPTPQLCRLTRSSTSSANPIYKDLSCSKAKVLQSSPPAHQPVDPSLLRLRASRSPSRWTTPLRPKPSRPTGYFASLWPVCFLQERQNFLVSRRSECFFLFFVVV